jgi:hypothetical protein
VHVRDRRAQVRGVQARLVAVTALKNVPFALRRPRNEQRGSAQQRLHQSRGGRAAMHYYEVQVIRHDRIRQQRYARELR